MMPKATIIIDTYRLLDDKYATKVVENTSDYPLAYMALKEAIHSSTMITLHVRNNTVATWLEHCIKIYDETRVTLQTSTPKDVLEEKWQIAVPSEVTDYDIIQAGLLKVHITPREGLGFWDVLLEHFYSEIFAYKTFPLGNLATLLNDYHKNQREKTVQYPLVVRAKNNKLAQWERSADREVLRMIVQRLTLDPNGLRQDLIYYKLLRNYPEELKEKILKGIWQTFDSLHIPLEALRFAGNDVKEAVLEIEYYLQEQIPYTKDTEDIQRLLNQMSGYLSEEFSVIEYLAKQYPEYLTPSLLRHIEQRFRPIRDLIEASLGKLRLIVPPSKPQKPDVLWDTAQWLKWITTEYMPYYAWLDAQGKREADIAEYAFVFADWFYENFLSIKHGSPQYFAYNSLYQERERMLEKDAITLVVIVDDLNFSYFDVLMRQFQQQEFALEDVKPLFSLIPTATTVAKAALIVGQGEKVDGLKGYTNLLKKAWSPILPDKKIKYLANIGELQSEHKLTHDVYFLNYLPIDEALHEDNRDSGRSHSDVIHDLLASLAKDIASFAKRFRIEHRLNIYVLSDHGSTRIPQDSVNVIDQNFFKKLSVEKHHRFISLTDDKFVSLPQVANLQCYLIDRQSFETNHNYLIARQYYRFIKTEENFYVHGGLTPEEVVVPFARFTRRLVTPDHPTVRLLDREFRYAVKSKVALEIGNPNNFPLESLSFSLVDADADETYIMILAAKQITRINLQTIFRRMTGVAKTRSLTLRVRYECQGRSFTAPEQTFGITMKSLMEVNDDDFDF